MDDGHVCTCVPIDCLPCAVVTGQVQERRKHIYSNWAYGVECDEVEHLTLTLLAAIRTLYSSVAGLPSDAVANILRKIDELVREYMVRLLALRAGWVLLHGSATKCRRR
jgi:hypothetical protein